MTRSAERAARAQRLFEWPLLVAALLVLPSLALQDDTLGEPWNAIGAWLDLAIWLVFVAELVVMMIVVPSRREWLRRNWLSPVIVFLTPPVLPPALAGIRLLRLLRLLQMLRGAGVARRVFSLDGLRGAALVLFVTVVLGGIAFAAVQPGPDGSDISLVDGIWLSVTTVTTIGYGDIVPTTDSARLIAVMVMGVGLGFVALLAGAMAERFLNLSPEEEEAEGDRDVTLRELRALREEVTELRRMIERGPPRSSGGGSG